MKALILAALSSIAIQPIIFLSWFIVPAIFDGDRFAYYRVFAFLPYVIIVAVLIVVLVGVPVFYLLRLANKTKPFHLALSGFFTAMIPAIILNWPLGCTNCSIGSTWHGKYVELLIQGHVTLYGWLHFMQTLLQFGAHGLAGGLIFGLVWQRAARR